MPDDELMRVAKAGTLRQPAVLEAQVRRMMADPKGYNLVENWAAQWLQLRNLGRTKPDPKRFPTVDDELLDAMRKETSLFVETIIKEDRSLLDFIDAPFTFVNGPLARHYGIKGVDGEEFQRVTLDGEQRSGVLTQGAILTVSSYPTRTSPPVRGKWVMENLLGTPPPPPPDDVPSLNESNIGTEVSLRERLEQHRRDPNCSPCHMLMDPLGFGLENYDAVGAWRTHGRQVPDRAVGHAARRAVLRRVEGIERNPEEEVRRVREQRDRKDADLQPRARARALRSPDGRGDHPSGEGERVQVFGARDGSREEQTVPDAECGGREAMNLIFKKQLPRRTFLRGMGSVVALPLLDAMVPAFVKAAGSSPTRVAILYFPNGVQMDTWAIKSDAQIAALPDVLPRTLAPLTKYRNDITVLSGLTVDGGRAHGDGPGDHGRAGASYLTGAHPKKTFGKDLQAGISFDQYAAGIIGNQTRFASLELGCEEGIQGGNCDNGYSCAYSNSISWRTPSTPNPPEIRPRAVFERLFGSGEVERDPVKRARQEKYQKSVLDSVLQDAKRLERAVGVSDRRKLDEYLYAVRDIETRIQKTESESAVNPEMDRPSPSVPENYDEHTRIMFDLMTTAFQTDSTRIITFLMAIEQSNRAYREIGIADSHHGLTHHGGDKEKIEKCIKINRFQIDSSATSSTS